MAPLPAADIEIGEALPALDKRFTQVDLVAYGAGTWNWHWLHYDLYYARSKNLPGNLADGQAYGAVSARAAQDWAGPRAFVARMAQRSDAPVVTGQSNWRVCPNSPIKHFTSSCTLPLAGRGQVPGTTQYRKSS